MTSHDLDLTILGGEMKSSPPVPCCMVDVDAPRQWQPQRPPLYHAAHVGRARHTPLPRRVSGSSRCPAAMDVARCKRSNCRGKWRAAHLGGSPGRSGNPHRTSWGVGDRLQVARGVIHFQPFAKVVPVAALAPFFLPPCGQVRRARAAALVAVGYLAQRASNVVAFVPVEVRLTIRAV